MERVSWSLSLRRSEIQVPVPPQASAKGASGPRLAPAIRDTRAVTTIPGALRYSKRPVRPNSSITSAKIPVMSPNHLTSRPTRRPPSVQTRSTNRRGSKLVERFVCSQTRSMPKWTMRIKAKVITALIAPNSTTSTSNRM
jgi:hypothetical protein